MTKKIGQGLHRKGPAYERAPMFMVRDTPRERLCLMSDPDRPHRFSSHHIGERICPDCKGLEILRGVLAR